MMKHTDVFCTLSAETLACVYIALHDRWSKLADAIEYGDSTDEMEEIEETQEAIFRLIENRVGHETALALIMP